jgi:hypothetical protein
VAASHISPLNSGVFNPISNTRNRDTVRISENVTELDQDLPCFRKNIKVIIDTDGKKPIK